jgi:hypothetical protein
MAVDTTFSMFVELLKESIDANTSLTSIMKSGLKARADALPRQEMHNLTVDEVNSSTGMTLDAVHGVITVPIGPGGEIVFDLITFDTPVRVSGGLGPFGALIGHTGQGSNPVIDNADLTMKYRTSVSGAWKAFDRTVMLDELSTVQFGLDVAAQVAIVDIPQLHIIAEQL